MLPSGFRGRRPNRVDRRAGTVAIVLLVVGTAFATPLAPHLVAALADSARVGAQMLAAAASTLSEGSGPAAGTAEACSVGSGGAATCGPSANGSTGWSTVSGPAPPARELSTMAYDAADGYVVLFGGCGRVCAMNDTWTFANGVWTNVTGTTGPTPPGRSDAAMTYFDDAPSTTYVLMFGGLNPTGFLQDTWGFAGGHWKKILAGGAGHAVPAGRFGAALTYDNATHDAVLFGGGGYYKLKTYLNDTWTFDGAYWTIDPTNASPAPRINAAIGYDPSLATVVLFGGLLTTGFGHDTWELAANGTWVKLVRTVFPSARGGAVFAWDPALGGLFLFGGLSQYGFLNDSWEFNGKWVPLSAPGAPPQRTWAASTFDPATGSLLVFGGWNLSRIYGDVWSYGNLSNATDRTTALAGAAPNRNVTALLVPIPALALSARATRHVRRA